MHILTWVAFIGVAINGGSILVAYIISYYNPEAAEKLYKGLDLHQLRDLNFWYYTQSVSFIIVLWAMKAYVLYLVITALSKVKLENPFKIEVVKLLEQISYILIGTWVVGTLYNQHINWLFKRTGISQEQWATDELFFLSGIVFIISQIFKRGVEIQSENELTV